MIEADQDVIEEDCCEVKARNIIEKHDRAKAYAVRNKLVQRKRKEIRSSSESDA